MAFVKHKFNSALLSNESQSLLKGVFLSTNAQYRILPCFKKNSFVVTLL